MAGGWFGNAIGGLAQQFGGFPSVSTADLPGIEPIQRPAPVQPINLFAPMPQQTGGFQGAPALGDIPQIGKPEYTDPNTGQAIVAPRQAPGYTLNDLTSAFAPPPTTTGGWGSGGNVSAMGGEWSTLDQLNPAISKAATDTGVPPNLIKAMLAREGSFGNDKYAADVGRTWQGGVDHVYAFNGIFQSTAQSYGIDFNRMTHDDAYAVWAMGRVLQGIKQNNPELGSWDNVAKFYFAGPNWDKDWTDETGTNTPDNYAYGDSGVVTRWKQLDQAAGYKGGYGDFGGASGPVDWNSIVRGGAVMDWGEFGKESDNGLYHFGTQYGLDGTQHTGVDIVTPRGSTYYAPVSGTVTCAGTGVGPGADGGGCAAYGDTGGGAGRVEIQLDNGAILIFGHSEAALLQPGQHVNAGQALGISGTMNSDHIHLEARVRDPSMPSGWRIVDPRTVMGGASGVGTDGGTGNSWMDRLNQTDPNSIGPRWSGW